MKSLPEQVTYYSQSPNFTASTTPSSLTRDHTTKAGVWGVITVTAGTVEYVIPSQDERHILSAEKSGIVEPMTPHYVTPDADAEFCVKFHK